MTQQEQAYVQGFVEKCAEYNVNAEELVKEAGGIGSFLKALSGKTVKGTEELLRKNDADYALNSALKNTTNDSIVDVLSHSGPLSGNLFRDSAEQLAEAVKNRDAANTNKLFRDRNGKSWVGFHDPDVFREGMAQATRTGDSSLQQHLFKLLQDSHKKDVHEAGRQSASTALDAFDAIKGNLGSKFDEYGRNMENLTDEGSRLRDRLLKDKTNRRNARLATGGTTGLGLLGYGLSGGNEE